MTEKGAQKGTCAGSKILYLDLVDGYMGKSFVKILLSCEDLCILLHVHDSLIQYLHVHAYSHPYPIHPHTILGNVLWSKNYTPFKLLFMC